MGDESSEFDLRDLHCHILPGVDDGARDINESLEMFDAARRAGVTSMTCTPHCRDPYFSFDGMWEAFRDFERRVHEIDVDFPLQMGFEVSYAKLEELGLNWADRLCFDGSNELLLELSVGASPSRFGDYERTIFELQGMGFAVIIAHPERYAAIRKSPALAEELVGMGCKLQLSSDFIRRGRLSKEGKLGLALLKRDRYSYVASDAHNAGDYRRLEKVLRRWGDHFENARR